MRIKLFINERIGTHQRQTTQIIARIRMASSGVTLSHLPHDVLLTILQQGLGPRELCRLEQCSKQFREL